MLNSGHGRQCTPCCAGTRLGIQDAHAAAQIQVGRAAGQVHLKRDAAGGACRQRERLRGHGQDGRAAVGCLCARACFAAPIPATKSLHEMRMPTCRADGETWLSLRSPCYPACCRGHHLDPKVASELGTLRAFCTHQRGMLHPTSFYRAHACIASAAGRPKPERRTTTVKSEGSAPALLTTARR